CGRQFPDHLFLDAVAKDAVDESRSNHQLENHPGVGAVCLSDDARCEHRTNLPCTAPARVAARDWLVGCKSTSPLRGNRHLLWILTVAFRIHRKDPSEELFSLVPTLSFPAADLLRNYFR